MKSETKSLKLRVFTKLVLFPVVLGLFFFLPAGTLDYWQAWTYMAVIFIPFLFVIIYLFKKDPELIKRRMQYKEKEKEQKMIVKYYSLFYILIYLIPGFDIRFSWSLVPDWLVIASDIMVFAGYMICVGVFKQNSYSSRIVEVAEGQKVISTGLYSLVRHPMYSGVTLMMFFTPTALGSYWALIPAIVIPIVLIIRLLNEEKVLRVGLAGYSEYCEKTKFRLIPFIW
jgi:protein-S-isoprenylcysteine O-methyltransferase Ste14